MPFSRLTDVPRNSRNGRKSRSTRQLPRINVPAQTTCRKRRSAFCTRARTNRSALLFPALHVGRFAVAAFALVAAEGPDARLRLAGTGPGVLVAVVPGVLGRALGVEVGEAVRVGHPQ